jgi:hypothetical protein
LAVATDSQTGVGKHRLERRPAIATKFAQDGWNLLGGLNAPSKAVAFCWGLDFSGSNQGTGGVGGLVEVLYPGLQSSNCFAGIDKNRV